jgi:hypothetical protein
MLAHIAIDEILLKPVHSRLLHILYTLKMTNELISRPFQEELMIWQNIFFIHYFLQEHYTVKQSTRRVFQSNACEHTQKHW